MRKSGLIVLWHPRISTRGTGVNHPPHTVWLESLKHYISSQIVLVLLSSGEAYLVDLRPEHRGRYELVEMIAEPETEEEAQASRSRCFPFHVIRPRGR